MFRPYKYILLHNDQISSIRMIGSLEKLSQIFWNVRHVFSLPLVLKMDCNEFINLCTLIQFYLHSLPRKYVLQFSDGDSAPLGI